MMVDPGLRDRATPARTVEERAAQKAQLLELGNLYVYFEQARIADWVLIVVTAP
jgi:hypothetical protein